MVALMGGLHTRIEWLDAPGVTSPDLAATWARYEIWVGEKCVTQVETPDGTIRRSIFGSLYPLAEWVATNWWFLTTEVRPSAIDTRYWTWRNIRQERWLSRHNLRAAGDGMAWPDCTVVPEGSVSRIVWAPTRSSALQFLSTGNVVAPSREVAASLAALVEDMLTRLSEMGQAETPLHKEWRAISQADGEERDFCATVARMGLDPYEIEDDFAKQVIEVATQLAEDLALDFFDGVDPKRLSESVQWARRAMSAADRASTKANRAVGELVPLEGLNTLRNTALPWSQGYGLARHVRRQLSSKSTDKFDLSSWIGVSSAKSPSPGLQGVATIHGSRCGLAISDLPNQSARRFAQARALGRVLLRPEARSFILSSARRDDERGARAFAAELLAPAEGIRELLETLGSNDDQAMEAAAVHYGVSPLLVRYQFENQLGE